jgi:hypothetical protein
MERLLGEPWHLITVGQPITMVILAMFALVM